MRRVALIVLLSISAAMAADKDKGRFTPGPAGSYPGHQTLEKVTIAAVPFITDEETTAALGKVNPNKYAVLPVLLILENGTGGALRLDLHVQYVDDRGKHIEATPATDVVYIGSTPQKPKAESPLPIPLPKRSKKGPLSSWEIEGRAFASRLLPAGESVSGFFYFQTSYKPGSKLYLTGIKDAYSGKEFFYFEAPLEKQTPEKQPQEKQP
jgi:hypothetical protein